MPDITEESDATPDEAYELGWLAAMDESEKYIEKLERIITDSRKWYQQYGARLENRPESHEAARELHAILNTKRK